MTPKTEQQKEYAHKVWAIEERNIIRTEQEIARSELSKPSAKLIPPQAKERNWAMSQFDTWDEYELYRFCQSAQTNIAETKKHYRNNE